MKWDRGLLWTAAFVGGVVTLGIELAASRMLGNIYGTSDIVWAGVIAMMLAYLTLGYFVGGRWADRHPQAGRFHQLVAWAGITSALIPLVARPALRGAALGMAALDIPAILLWLALTVLVFIVPLGLLGAISPYVIRLGVDDPSQSGRVAGRAYALTTLGSLGGAYLAVLWLIPTLGSTFTVIGLAGVLYLLGLVGLLISERRTGTYYAAAILPLIGLGLLAGSGPIKPPPPGLTLLYEKETPYNLVQVVETPEGTRYLLLNEGVAVHSIYNPAYDLAYTGGVWDYFLIAPYFNPPPYTPDQVERVAVIGLAGGTIAKQYTGVYGPIPIEGLEIDPDLVTVGRDYFGMDMPNLTPIVGDGRVALRGLGNDYSVIIIDAYKVPYVPWHLATVEFFEEVESHLAENGVIALNVGRTPINRELINAITATLDQVFPSVYVVDVPNTFNSIVVATRQPTDGEDFAANLRGLPESAHPMLSIVMNSALQGLQPTDPGGIILTDDHAPVEGIVHGLLFQFILEGGTDQIGKLGE